MAPPTRLARRVSPAEVEEVAALYRAGSTTPELAERFGVSRNGVIGLLRGAGVTLRFRPLNNEQQLEAVRLYADGMAIQRIADRFDVSYNCVRQHFVRAGVPRRPRGGSAGR